ncbi:MAG TPA: PilZ domain-containing protein [Candidatus Methylomirabilis sp.]|nr:PilZ domain-containing protein [Candidatus Methylomirabilis sp.]
MSEAATQRRHPRYQIQLPLLYKLSAPSRKFGVGWTRNLSEGGALVELDDRVPPDTTLSLSLRTDSGSIEIEARVTWAEETRRFGRDVLHNLAFAKLSPSPLQALRDLLLPLSMVPHAGGRLPLEVPVTCRHKGRPGSAVKGRTGDVDRGGLLLYLTHRIAPGTPLAVTLHTTKGTVIVEGEVVWAQSRDGKRAGELSAHGLRFTSPSWTISLALGLLLAESR